MPRRPWVPRPEEARFFHHIYIDESSQNDHDYMVLGGIVAPLAFSAQLEEDIYNAKPESFQGIGKTACPVKSAGNWSPKEASGATKKL
jgi:hypothetical protein